MRFAQVDELVYRALEMEKIIALVYRTALCCAQRADLKREWMAGLGQAEDRERTLRSMCEGLGLDPEWDTPERLVLRDKGAALLSAMEAAIKAGNRAAAQLVAVECIVDAEAMAEMETTQII